MKITVFGGAGDMGAEAVRDLAAQADVDSLVIADFNSKAAEKLAAEIGKPHVKAEFCDANDCNSLVEMMERTDVCLSCVGPFYQYEEKMVRAAIDAKRNYVSICDDFDAVEAVLAMDKPAKKAGIIVLTGMGWTPGLSNVLARKGIEDMDSATKVHVSWAGGADDSEGVAVIKHTLHVFTGDVPSYIGGKWKKVGAGSGREKVEFPAPIGKISVYHLGHPEPVTIPHFMKGLDEVSLKGAITPEWLNPVAKAFSAVGLTNTKKKRDAGATFFHAVGPTLFKGREKSVSGVHVRVIGEKGGDRVVFTGTCVDRMKRLTGIPASIGALMIGRKTIEVKGVTAPEVAVPAELFLAELRKRGLKIETKMKKV